MISKLICWFIRLFGGSHKWRRLHKGETYYIPAEQVPFDPKTHRVCGRCGIVRGVRPKKATP